MCIVVVTMAIDNTLNMFANFLELIFAWPNF